MSEAKIIDGKAFAAELRGRVGATAGRGHTGSMYAIFWLVDTVIGFYIALVIAQIVLSWLVSFNVVNTRNRFVYIVGDFLYRVTEPALRPIRRLLPSFGGIDLSAVVLLLGLYFVRMLLIRDLAPRLL